MKQAVDIDAGHGFELGESSLLPWVDASKQRYNIDVIHKFELGDIFHGCISVRKRKSIKFYVVTKLVGNTMLELTECASERIEDVESIDGLHGQLVPNSSMLTGEVWRRKPDRSGRIGNLKSGGDARPWDGTPLRFDFDGVEGESPLGTVRNELAFLPPPTMKAQDYRDALKTLRLPQSGAASFFGVNPRTSRRWADTDPDNSNDVPRAVEMVLRIMIAKGLSVADVHEIMPKAKIRGR